VPPWLVVDAGDAQKPATQTRPGGHTPSGQGNWPWGAPGTVTAQLASASATMRPRSFTT
jgi:hypothetical protein